jgi:PadR family transcriptional regulator
MKGTHLGELEELVLLTTAILDDNAYTVTIAKEIQLQSNRSITISTVHTSLHRLEQKGFVESYVGGTTKERGGRRKRLYKIKQTGFKALNDAKELRNRMWEKVPKLSFD